MEKRKIYDGFMFYNEFDLLELRLNELWDVVDWFVLVEGDMTFQGRPKPYIFEQQAERFKPYMSKIRHVKMHLIYDANVWNMETQSRNGISQGLYDAQPDDYVIIADVDEIPRAKAIAACRHPLNTLIMGFYYYKFNLKNDGDWVACKMVRVGSIDRPLNDYRRYGDGFAQVRDGGWHFSKCFSKEMIIEMLQAFSHPEYYNEDDVANLDRYISEGLHHGNKWQKFVPTDTKRHPAWLLEHKDDIFKGLWHEETTH